MTMTTTPRLLNDPDFEYVNAGYRELLPVPVATESHLSGVIRDTLDYPGSLARAQLAFGVMASRGVPRERARAIAIAIEYFHTASLLFDDLPGMDNATTRRGRPCGHVLHGEAAAQLGALAFITKAYALIWDSIASLPAERRIAASRLVENSLGVCGILNGQARDLHFAEGPRTAEATIAVSRGKTVTLIRLTLGLAALVAGADEPTVGTLDQLSESWGLAYQILDDFKDCLLTASESGKTHGRDALLGRPNYAMAAGVETARLHLRDLLQQARRYIASLCDAGWEFEALHRLQGLLEHEAARIETRLNAAA